MDGGGMSPSVYLIHFSTNYKHARHYAGWTPGTVEDRLNLHKSGNGSRLCQVVTDTGLELVLARVWDFKNANEARRYERTIKKCGKAKYCPICKKLRLFGKQ
jgi:predicted GIY-YIG superfamily endonuclease